MIRVALPFGKTPERKRIAYRNALEGAGIQPVEDAISLDGLDGLLLAGGTDVDPALYGSSRRNETAEPDRDRDCIEARLLREALDRDIPVLAICRGLQLLNVVQGGTLVQHIEGHKCSGAAGRPPDQDRVGEPSDRRFWRSRVPREFTPPSMRGPGGERSGCRRQRAGRYHRGVGDAGQELCGGGAVASRGSCRRAGRQAVRGFPGRAQAVPQYGHEIMLNSNWRGSRPRLCEHLDAILHRVADGLDAPQGQRVRGIDLERDELAGEGHAFLMVRRSGLRPRAWRRSLAADEVMVKDCISPGAARSAPPTKWDRPATWPRIRRAGRAGWRWSRSR